MNQLGKIFLSFFLSVFCYQAVAQYRTSPDYEALYDSDNVASMKAHVISLSSESMKGREPGSQGEAMAAEYVRNKFVEYGLDLLTPEEGETFGIKIENGDTITSRNVIAYVQGYDVDLRDHYIVVGARLDNRGTMTMTVNGDPVEKVYYGANGNASGLSMMLELAKMVNTNAVIFRRSVIFVAFGASTKTFAGSWYFLNRVFTGKEQIDAMINLDMLGTGYNGFYAYTSSNSDMNSLIETISGQLHPVLPEVVAYEPYPSDHRSFYSAEIPSVFFTTGRYAQHDTERDTYDIIDFGMMERELEYIYNFTLNISNVDETPSFNSTTVVNSASSAKDVVPYYECDQLPTFFNSSDPRSFLKRWVYQYLKYPEAALRNGVQGRVMVEFIIEKNGNVSNVRVVKGVSDELDAEAVKVVSASPQWKPGKVDGQRVRTSMTLPIEFKLEKKSKR